VAIGLRGACFRFASWPHRATLSLAPRATRTIFIRPGRFATFGMKYSLGAVASSIAFDAVAIGAVREPAVTLPAVSAKARSRFPASMTFGLQCRNVRRLALMLAALAGLH
jgi:hypothetical protein